MNDYLKDLISDIPKNKDKINKYLELGVLDSDYLIEQVNYSDDETKICFALYITQIPFKEKLDRLYLVDSEPITAFALANQEITQGQVNELAQLFSICNSIYFPALIAFATKVENPPIQTLYEILANAREVLSKNYHLYTMNNRDSYHEYTWHVLEFALKVPNAPLDEIADYISNSFNEEDIAKAIKKFPAKYHEKLLNSLMKSFRPYDDILEILDCLNDKLYLKACDLILEEGQAKHIFSLTENRRPCLSLDKIGEALLKKEDLDLMVEFAKKYNILLNEFATRIIELCDNDITARCYYPDKPDYIGRWEKLYDFAMEVPGAPIDMIIDEIIKRDNVLLIGKFINVKEADKNKLYKALLKSENYNEIIEVAKEHPNTIYINLMLREIIATQNPKYIYRYALEVPDAPINVLAFKLIKTNDLEYIYRFARDVKSAPITILISEIVASDSVEYIQKAIENVPGAPIEFLQEALKRLELENNYTQETKILQELDKLYEDNNLKEIKNNALIYKKVLQED